MRIAQVAPLTEAVPPKLYGGTERVVHWLTEELVTLGHDVTLFTNYPKWAVKRFGFPPERVRSFWIHGIISKCAYRLNTPIRLERWLNPPFGAWVAGELDKERWDVIHPWSGVSEEPCRRSQNRCSLNLLMRGSAHIRTQDAIFAKSVMLSMKLIDPSTQCRQCARNCRKAQSCLGHFSRYGPHYSERNFRATWRPSLRSLALYTTPMPPPPRPR